MKRFLSILSGIALILLTACGLQEITIAFPRTVSVEERGSVAKIYPKGGEARVDRHGLWAGYDAEGVKRWEIRYTRGNPAGAYREWDAHSRLIAEWAYNWDGQLDGEALWYHEDGEVKQRCTIFFDEKQPDFDSLGESLALSVWCEGLEAQRAAQLKASSDD